MNNTENTNLNTNLVNTSSAQWQQQWDTDLQHNYAQPQLKLEFGQGSYLWDDQGRKYLDLLSGIAVNALGQAHPAVVNAVTEQMKTLGHVSNIFAHDKILRLAEKIKSLVGVPEAQVFFANSGAEANEAAFKLARLTGRTKILAAENGFHGRTMGALALTGQSSKRALFEPMPAGVEFYTFGDIDSLRALADIDTAAIFLEPIQGETGIIPAPDGFLKDVRQLCDELGILMVVDEVQAGMGRTGQWFGYQYEDIQPDIITMAKGLGGGLPIGATVACGSAQLFTPGMHGTTFGGNPVVAAAALAVIDEIETLDLLQNVQEIGNYFIQQLSQLPGVKLVRGRGLMLGIVTEFPLTSSPADFGLLLNLPAEDVIRVVPPLNLSREEAQEAVEKLSDFITSNNPNV